MSQRLRPTVPYRLGIRAATHVEPIPPPAGDPAAPLGRHSRRWRAPVPAPPKSATRSVHQHRGMPERLRVEPAIGRVRRLIENRARPAIAVETCIPPTAGLDHILHIAHAWSGRSARSPLHGSGRCRRTPRPVWRSAKVLRVPGAPEHALEGDAHTLDFVQVFAERLDPDRRAHPVVNMSMRVRMGGAMAS